MCVRELQCEGLCERDKGSVCEREKKCVCVREREIEKESVCE